MSSILTFISTKAFDNPPRLTFGLVEPPQHLNQEIKHFTDGGRQVFTRLKCYFLGATPTRDSTCGATDRGTQCSCSIARKFQFSWLE